MKNRKKFRFHFCSTFFGTRTVKKDGVVVSYCPAISASQNGPQRYPGSCRDCVIPAQREISVRNRAYGMKRAWAQNHMKRPGVNLCSRYGNEFTVESVVKIQKDALPERIHNPIGPCGMTGSLQFRQVLKRPMTVAVNFRSSRRFRVSRATRAL